MSISGQRACLKATVDATLETFSRKRRPILRFPILIEDRFEQDTRAKRSSRMWIEGLVAILGFNLCLLLDYILVDDISWLSIVRHTALITPLALAVNAIVQRNPPRPVREAVVAVGMFAIAIINLVVEGRDSTASTLFGAICILISAMFVGVVMRLRFPYVLPTLCAMLVAGVWSVGHAPSVRPSEAIMGQSMLAIGIVIILVASASLEFEERNGYLVGLQRNLQAEELAWANQALREVSNIDNLTRLPNRRALDERVALIWKSSADRDKPLSAVVIDVDHFKLVNDAHGHLFGDEILRLIGAILPQALTSADDMAARFGGEEFVLLLPGTAQEAALSVAEHVRHLVETAAAFTNPDPSEPAIIAITVSCGVSTVLPGHLLEWNDLIAAADQALYLAKRSGRNRVEFCACMDRPPASHPVREQSDPRPGRHISKGRRAALTTRNPDNAISKIIARF